ncbi:hypothetical protein BZA70DRAFT_271264 [Myxozyma melibiosi]|uniref:Uncharacterized protein n=1 Tax=Myxozyma melibiosi TaxID=54550 RepID=A0ABR1FC44_9ASCO
MANIFLFPQFLSFRERVDNIKIDPLRRAKRHEDIGDKETESFFHVALQTWRDLNSTKCFTDFLHHVAPISQSLPQVLYHKSEIFDRLITAIAEKERFALQPLLDLLVQFAHDIGPDFEEFLSRAITVLITVATHEELEVVEWTFNCLAYLFKHLYRFLVTKLSDTFDLISPLFSQQERRPYLSRFAAESFSFFLRNAKSVDLFVDHAFEQLSKSNSKNFEAAMSIMFAEALKGPDAALHSKAGKLARKLQDYCTVEQHEKDFFVFLDIITDVLHHVNNTTSEALYESLYKWMKKQLKKDDVTAEKVWMITKEMFLLTGLRRGSRVPNWDETLAVYREICQTISRLPRSEARGRACWELCKLTQCLLQYNDDIEESVASRIIETIYLLDDGEYFIPFCDYIIDLRTKNDMTRIVWLYLQRYLDGVKSMNDYTVLAVLEILKKWWSITGRSDTDAPIKGNQHLRDSLLQSVTKTSGLIRSGEASTAEILSLLPRLELLNRIFNSTVETKDCILELVKSFSEESLELSDSLIKVYGIALSLLANYLQKCSDDALLEDVLGEAYERVAAMKTNKQFINGLVAVVDLSMKSKSISQHDSVQKIFQKLSADFESPLRSVNPGIRLESLRLLQVLSGSSDEASSEMLSLCLSIEETPFELATARTFSMNIRRIALDFPALTGERLKLNVLSYTFGLLTSQFQPVWTEAAATLAKLAQNNRDKVWDLIYEGITAAAPEVSSKMDLEFSSLDDYDPSSSYEFKCTHVQFLNTKGAEVVARKMNPMRILQEFDEKDTFTSKIDRDIIRHRCFEVLANISKIAEKRSSDLIPLFYSCIDAIGRNKSLLLDILKLFSKFNNPAKSLDSDNVYDNLVRLLSNPDSDVQKAALNCIFAFGDSAVNLYKDNLENLLGGQVFRDEINRLLLTNEDGAIITAEHAPSVIPLIVHILYGSAIGHSGNNSKAKSANRTTIISTIGGLSDEYLLMFVGLASEGIPQQFMIDFSTESPSIPDYSQMEIGHGHLRRISGFMTMAEDMLRLLKDKVGRAGDVLLQAVISCIVYCRDSLKAGSLPSENLTIIRSIRSAGFKCLHILFQDVHSIDWNKYQRVIFEEVIMPRMEFFKDENTGEVSPIFKLFLVWSSSEGLVGFLSYNDTIIPQILALMESTTAKEPVYLATVQFMANLIGLQEDTTKKGLKNSLDSLNRKTLELFLPRFVKVLSGSRSPELVQLSVSVLRKILAIFGEYILQNEVLLEQLVDVCLSGITAWGYQSHHINDVFDVLATLISAMSSEILLKKSYDELSPLLLTVKERHTRASLISIFSALGAKNDSVKLVADLLVELNSYAKVRLDELDYDRRFSAYARLNVDLWKGLSYVQWRPILYESVFCIATCEEIAVKKAASSTIKQFVERTETKASSEDLDRVEFYSLMEAIVIPGLRSGLRSENEFTRNEYLLILKLLVQKPLAFPKVKELEVLLFNGDEEADFFNNIVHIQSHRRQRAIYRLGQIALTHDLGDYNIAHFLLPVMEHFLRDVTEATSGMAEEAISTIGKLCMGLSLTQYQAVVRRCVMNLEKQQEKIKFHARLLDSVAEATYLRSQLGESAEVQLKKFNSRKLDVFLTGEVVPKLRGILRLTDENSLADRVGITSPLVKFLSGTSDETLTSNLANVVLELSQHLKHRYQEIRDSVRKVLSKVCLLVGLTHLNLILKNIKSVLTRGSHRHILSYSVHSFLIALMATPMNKHGALDDSIEILMDICMDDILGVSGSEKDAEGYVSKVREVRENKSYDSIEILATNISVERFGDLLAPVRRILSSEFVNLKTEKKINEVLRRMNIGISMNEEGCTHQVIAFCLQICSEEVKDTDNRPAISEKEKRFLISQAGRRQKYTAQNLHYLQRFALDVIKNCLRKNRELIEAFELQEFVKSLTPYLTSDHEDIQLSSLKLLTTAAKYSSLLQKLDTRFLFTYVVGIIQNSPSTQAEACQTGLKLLSSLMQKKKYTEGDHKSIAYIIQKIYIDLVEPDKQTHSFSFIKSVLLQKLMMPEIYDALDKIREIMVNSPSKNTREVCKSLYCQFLMEYPQGRGRLNKQMRFLVHNLNYEHASGRESVMEVLYVLLSKSKDDFVQTIIETFFVPLTMTLVNDESEDCKEMALLLFRTIVQKANADNSEAMLRSCVEWSSQKDTAELVEAAAQIMEILKEFGKGK